MDTTIPELTPDLARRLHKDAEDEQAFFVERHEEFLKKYVKQFVVVRNRKVIGHSPDLSEASRIVERNGLNIRDVWLHYVPDPDELWIL